MKSKIIRAVNFKIIFLAIAFGGLISTLPAVAQKQNTDSPLTQKSLRIYNQFGPAYLQSRGPGELGGGGHPIESLVKQKILALSVQIREMTAEQKTLLTFNADDFYISMNTPDSFYALCATNESAKFNYLERLETMGKSAAVFRENTNIIYLDCKNTTEEQWKAKVFSNLPFHNRFFLHEAMRTLNFENENDYHQSNSYLKALMATSQYKTDLRNFTIKNLLDGTNKICSLRLESINYLNQNSGYARATDIKLLMGHVAVSNYRCFETIENCSVMLMGGDAAKLIHAGAANDIQAMAELIYNSAKRNNCGE